MKFARPFFKEFTVQVSTDAAEVLRRLLKAGYHGGLPTGRWYGALKNCISISVTEKRTREELDGLAPPHDADAGGPVVLTVGAVGVGEKKIRA